MSCVCALKIGDHFVFASDSQTTCDETNYMFVKTKDDECKLTCVKGDSKAIIAHVGNTAEWNLISEINNLVDLKDGESFDIDYIRNKMVNTIKNYFYDFGYIENKNQYKFVNTIMVARDDKCYRVDMDGSIYSIKDFISLGSGANPAIGTFYSSVKINNPLIRLLKSIKSAIKYDIYCDFPVNIRTSKDNSVRYLLDEKELDEIISGEKELII